MFIELEPIFNNIGAEKKFDYQMDMSKAEFNGIFPFKTPVMVKGVIKNEVGIVVLDAKAQVLYEGACDRCAADMKKTFSASVSHTLVSELNDEGNDDFILIEDMHFDLDEIVREDIFLSLPTKVLCKTDCAGICPQCGADLNVESCNCKREIDPRLAVLQQLLDDE